MYNLADSLLIQPQTSDDLEFFDRLVFMRAQMTLTEAVLWCG